MHLALFSAGVFALVASSRAQACGREILAYNFDDHRGDYSQWNISDLEKVWPKLDARPDFRGNMHPPGLVYTEGIERASVGEQNLLLFMPEVRIVSCYMLFVFS